MSSTWLKDNLFIAAALALPLVVVVFFLAATTVPRFLVDDPAYDLLFTVDHYDAQRGQISLSFRVADGQVFADARANPAYQVSPTQRLYRFDGASAGVRRIPTEIPEEILRDLQRAFATQQGTDRLVQPPMPPVGAPGPGNFPVTSFPVAETQSLRVLNAAVSPDGYAFETRRDDGHGLFGELFGMGSSRSTLRIAKAGRIIAIPNIPDADVSHYYYANARALGWIDQ